MANLVILKAFEQFLSEEKPTTAERVLEAIFISVAS